MKITGIYKIESKLKPERIYIGSAVNISKRWLLHLSRLRRDKHKKAVSEGMKRVWKERRVA